jgi:hypothetical protein
MNLQCASQALVCGPFDHVEREGGNLLLNGKKRLEPIQMELTEILEALNQKLHGPTPMLADRINLQLLRAVLMQ